MRISFFLFLLVAIVFSKSCIPIEDKISPRIEGSGIDPVYFYEDTIQFSAIFVDNYGLDSGSVEIQKFPLETGGEGAWYYQSSFEMAGRRIEPEFKIVVPSFKETGTYLLTVYGFDEGDNPDTLLHLFQLQADTSKPIFHETSLELPKNNKGTYLACRSEVIPVHGYVTDNIKMRLIGFSWNNREPNLTVNLEDTVALDTIFHEQLIVPSFIENGTTLQFSLIAVDTFDNISVKSFDILVDCDDMAPTFELVNSFPRINQKNRTFITQGGQLTISDLRIMDDRYLNHASVYFQKQGEALSPFGEASLSTTDTVNLANYLDLNFNIPLDAIPGTVYEVGLTAEDGSGNISEPVTIEIEVVEDAPPVIVVTDTYINNRQEILEPAPAQNLISAGSSVTLKGKIEEEYLLSSIEVYWYLEGESAQPIKEWFDVRMLPVSLANLHNEDTFVVPYDAQPGQVYVLSIVATDAKGQTAFMEYHMEVGL